MIVKINFYCRTKEIVSDVTPKNVEFNINGKTNIKY